MGDAGTWTEHGAVDERAEEAERQKKEARDGSRRRGVVNPARCSSVRASLQSTCFEAIGRKARVENSEGARFGWMDPHEKNSSEPSLQLGAMSELGKKCTSKCGMQSVSHSEVMTSLSEHAIKWHHGILCPQHESSVKILCGIICTTTIVPYRCAPCA